MNEHEHSSNIRELFARRAEIAAEIAALDEEIARALPQGFISPKMNASLMTMTDFARYIGVSRTTIYSLIKEGLPAKKLPHMGRRIDPAQGKAWILANARRKEARRANP